MGAATKLDTARLTLAPVAPRDLPQLVALKADPRAFGQMLGGVRTREQAVAELAEDIRLWGERGYGMFSVRAQAGGTFLGVTGLMHRTDGRGIALRFALWPKARGAGLAREAASAALFHAHDQAGLSTVIGIAREQNFSSRTVLGSIGMSEVERFQRDGAMLIVYRSQRRPLPRPSAA